jgi:hypothetical protein
LFAFAAVVSGICFGLQRRLLLWRRHGPEVVGDCIWKNLGRFSGWMCAGCAAAVVAWSARMRSIILDSESQIPGITKRQEYELRASASRHFTVYIAFYPLQLLCITYAMNLLLRRVSDHASHSYYNNARDQNRITGIKRFDWRDCIGQYRLYYMVRTMHVIAIVLCALLIVARIVLAAFRAERVVLYEEAAAACDAEGNDARSASDIKEWKERDDKSRLNRERALPVAMVLEASIFVFMAFGFLLFFPACIVMFRRVERRLKTIMQEMSLRSDVGSVFLPYEFSSAAADGERSQEEMPVVEAREFFGRMKSAAAAKGWRFELCLAILLISLLAQAIYSLFIAVIYAAASQKNIDCDSCGSCQRAERFMVVWYESTPEVFPLVSSLGCVLPLLFSLWLMTTREDRALMLNPGRFRADAVALRSGNDPTEARLKAERMRMGVDMR